MFTVEKEQVATIKKACKLAPNKSSNQAFECVHISCNEGKVTFTCGDGTSEMSSTIESETTLNFETMVNAAKFSQSIAAANGGKVELKDDLIVKNGRKRFKIKSLDPDMFPFFVESLENSEKMTTQEFMSLIDGVSFSASVNDVRYTLNGVHIGKCAVATNGHRMAVIELSEPLNDEVIIPIEAIKKMDITGGDAFIDAEKGNVVVIDHNESFKCKLIDGRFPLYEKVLPQSHDSTATVDRVEFIDALKASIISAPSDSKSIRLIIGQESKIESSTIGSSSSVIGFDAEFDSPTESGFNSSYLLDAFNALQSEKVTMKFDDRSMFIDQDGIKIVIMKVRL